MTVIAAVAERIERALAHEEFAALIPRISHPATRTSEHRCVTRFRPVMGRKESSNFESDPPNWLPPLPRQRTWSVRALSLAPGVLHA